MRKGGGGRLRGEIKADLSISWHLSQEGKEGGWAIEVRNKGSRRAGGPVVDSIPPSCSCITPAAAAADKR